MAQLHTILWSPAPASALYTRVFYARLQLEGSCSSTQVSFLLLLDFLLVRTDLFSAWRRWSLNTNQLSWTIFLQGLIIWDSSKQISEKFEACSSVGKRSNPRAFFFFFSASHFFQSRTPSCPDLYIQRSPDFHWLSAVWLVFVVCKYQVQQNTSPCCLFSCLFQ